MTRSRLLSYAVAIGAILHPLRSEEVPPNIVVILADDLGYGDLGCYGANEATTPNLDRLSREGVHLTQFYSNGPECSPTRTAFMTGRYQQRVGGLECAIGLGNVGRYTEALALSETGQLGLPVEFSVIPKIFTDSGYNTALIGKWHLGDGETFKPLAHGFDFVLGPVGGSIDYFHHTEPVGVFIGNYMEGNLDFERQGGIHHREGYYVTDLFSDEAVAWLNIQKAAKPFFLYVPYTAPHTPYQGPDDYKPEKETSKNWNSGSRETYREMVRALDAGVGKILRKLDEMNATENTLVIFFSDNGPTKKGSTGGLRGNKGQVFEGGIRVPCIIRWPGRIAAGTSNDQVSLSMDLTASIAAVLGKTPNRPFDGIDIIDHVVDAKPDFVRNVFWRKKRAETIFRAVRSGDTKYIRNIGGNDDGEFLFDLRTDGAEQQNLIESEPETAQQLRTLLEAWEAEVRPERT